MGIYETYSKRLKKREQAGQPDIFQYNEVPDALRVQIAHIWRDMFVQHGGLWSNIHDTLAREKGVFRLWGDSYMDNDDRCIQFLLNAPILDALDIIELSFRAITHIHELVSSSFYSSIEKSPEDAINELNERFREHGVGYQFEGGEIVRVDSQYVHAEAVKPAISLLNAAEFTGASDEFFDAHGHYRKGEYADAIADSLKAFESTMKAICDENGWSYASNATAQPLVKIVLDNGLVPKYMETHLAGLRNTLQAGLPTVRTKLGGHGQGKDPKKVHDYFAGYALHLAATNIVFLVEAHEALGR